MSDWTIVYYHNKRGGKVVREEIKSFGLNNHAKIITIIDMLADYGFNLPSRYIKHIEGKIWEIRIDRFRVLYFAFRNRHFVMLRAFIKKTGKTPIKEIGIAHNRLHDYVERSQEKNNDEN